jgi:endonuclease/exonuclease/phosphatase family metal-dependent hydrolase
VSEWRVLTWNVQGSHGLDIALIRAHIVAERADVVLIQEIHRRQAKRLATALQMDHKWARKHTPFPGWSEGMAIFARRPISEHFVEVVTSAPPWSWRRRIIIGATVANDASSTLRILNVHLSPHDAAERRAAELRRIAELDETHGWDVIAGDFNAELMTSPALSDHDDVAPHGPPTCWTSGPRSGRAPSQRLDGVFATPRWLGSELSTPSTDLDRWARVSDHLPVSVTIRERTPR